MDGFAALWPDARALDFEALHEGEASFEVLAPWSGLKPRQEPPRTAAVAPLPRVEEPAPAPEPEPVDAGLQVLREEARALGFAEGLQQGRDELQASLAQVAAVAEELAALRRSFFERSVQDLAEAVLVVARQIVQRELAVSSEGVETLLRGILDTLADGDEIVIHMAHEDDRGLRDAYPRLLETLGRHGAFRVELDEGLSPGGVLVQTSHGRVDATVESQFAAFAQGIETWAQGVLEPSDG